MSNDVCLSWNSHGKALTTGLWKFFQENYKTDLDLSLNGHYLKAHQLILAIFCPLIKEVEDDKFIKGGDLEIEKEDLKHLITFLYCGKINVPSNRLQFVLKSAEALGFQALANVIKKYLAVHDNNNPSHSKKMSMKLPNKRDKSENSIINNSFKDETAEALEENSTSDDQYFEGSYQRIDHSSFDPISLQFICHVCKDGFEVFADYSNHMRQHQNPKLPHQCTFCNYKTKLRKNLTEHLAAKHQVDKEGKKLERDIKCPQCSFTCCAKFQLRNHAYICHSEKQLKCTACAFATTSRAGLNEHVRLAHSDDRPFMCDTCGSRFKTFHGFRNHAVAHAGKKRVCEVCGASLSWKSFSSHMKTHSESRPHPSPMKMILHKFCTCCKSFFAKTYHWGCHLCSYAARKKYNLKIHLKNVHKISADGMELNNNYNSEIFEGDNHAIADAIMTISGGEFQGLPHTSAISFQLEN